MFRYKSKYKKVRSFYISICKCFQFSLHYCISHHEFFFACLIWKLDLEAHLEPPIQEVSLATRTSLRSVWAQRIHLARPYGSTGLFGNTAGAGLFGNTTGSLGFGAASSLQRGLGSTLGNSFGTSKSDIKCCCVYTIQNNKSTLAMIVCCIFSPRKYWNWFSKHVSINESQLWNVFQLHLHV